VDFASFLFQIAFPLLHINTPENYDEQNVSKFTIASVPNLRDLGGYVGLNGRSLRRGLSYLLEKPGQIND
jgi:hypothetical protein